MCDVKEWFSSCIYRQKAKNLTHLFKIFCLFDLKPISMNKSLSCWDVVLYFKQILVFFFC